MERQLVNHSNDSAGRKAPEVLAAEKTADAKGDGRTAARSFVAILSQSRLAHGPDLHPHPLVPVHCRRHLGWILTAIAGTEGVHESAEANQYREARKNCHQRVWKTRLPHHRPRHAVRKTVSSVTAPAEDSSRQGPGAGTLSQRQNGTRFPNLQALVERHPLRAVENQHPTQSRHYRHWYNHHRPHSAIDGLTPDEAWNATELSEPIPIRCRNPVKPGIRVRRINCRGDPYLPVIQITLSKAA